MATSIGLRRTMRNVIEDAARTYPDSVAIEFIADSEQPVASYTYDQIDRGCNRLANGLRALGVGKGAKVGIFLPNCPEMVLLFFALAKIGAVFAPCNINLAPREVEHLLNHSDALALVSEEKYLPMLEKVVARCPQIAHVIVARTSQPRSGMILFDDLIARGSDELEDCGVLPQDEIQFMYTSGTTALPKAVVHTHANCLWAIERSLRHTMTRHDDRNLVTLPLYHATAQSTQVLPTLAIGGCVVIVERFSAGRYMEQVRAARATVVCVVASMVRMLLLQPPTPRDRDHSVRLTLFGVSVSDEERHQFESRFNMYFVYVFGLTEAFTCLTWGPVVTERRWPSLGLPCVDRDLRVVDDDGKEVALGEVGELVARGTPGVDIMKGYYKDPEATAQTIRGGWLYTGDYVRMDEDGYVFFVDRKKDMIKRSGENVASLEIEQVLTAHPGIVEAAVIGVPDPVRDEAIKAFIVPVPGSALTAQQVIDYCAERLASFKVPQFIQFMDTLPKSATGKVMKTPLKRLHRTGQA